MNHPHIEFGAGTHIAEAAKMLVAARDREGCPVQGQFNDIVLVADLATTPDDIVVAFNRECARRSKEYRNSPEGKRAAAETEQRRSAAQSKHDALMAALPSLDMSNDTAVLDWLCGMQEPSDHVGVIIRRSTIVSVFESAGFVANANTGKNYKEGDRANMFRYLVGQALDGLKRGPAIHPIIHKFSDEWRKKFLH